MALTSNSHPYVKLDSRSKEIRFLELLPGQFDSPIEGRLKRGCLNDPIEYHALSYCWGNPSRTKPITLDGHRFLATESLEEALRYLRCQDALRTMWIDALCINQADDRERSQQVRLMAEIYRSAERVIVWLGGEEKEEQDHASQAVPPARPDQDESGSAVPTNADNRQRCIIDGVNIIPLFRRPWWQRVWVIQEVAVRNNTAVVVQYGQHTQRWGELRGGWG